MSIARNNQNQRMRETTNSTSGILLRGIQRFSEMESVETINGMRSPGGNINVQDLQTKKEE